MRIGNKNYLLAEKRGCNFFKNDASVAASDVGNYRVFICFKGKDGVDVFGDVTRFRGGDTLAAQMSYYDECGNCYGFRRGDQIDRNSCGFYPYTIAGILAYVNEHSSEHYDDIKWVESFTFDKQLDADFDPAKKIEEWADKEHLEHWKKFGNINVKTYTGVWQYMMHHTRSICGSHGLFDRVWIILEEAN